VRWGAVSWPDLGALGSARPCVSFLASSDPVPDDACRGSGVDGGGACGAAVKGVKDGLELQRVRGREDWILSVFRLRRC
jgi:hypothetical protein